jgi:hypothetical protein
MVLSTGAMSGPLRSLRSRPRSTHHPNRHTTTLLHFVQCLMRWVRSSQALSFSDLPPLFSVFLEVDAVGFWEGFWDASWLLFPLRSTGIQRSSTQLARHEVQSQEITILLLETETLARLRSERFTEKAPKMEAKFA